MSVRFSFKKSGEMIGPPRLTFATRVVPGRHPRHLPEGDQRLAERLHGPVKLTSRLGGAAGGRPIAIRMSQSRLNDQVEGWN